MEKIQIFMRRSRFLSVSILFILFFTHCKSPDQDGVKEMSEVIEIQSVEHPDWVKDAVIYEINTRQFSQEGNFKGVEDDLSRLDELGVDILWFMPVHPIGQLNKKGEMGSYYSVKDYQAVNPEFGTMEDFKSLVDQAHQMGMKVILDWVPNHSAWDNPLAKEHPEWYIKDSAGVFVSPFDWTDVIQFDYDNPELREYMIESMIFWIEQTNIDGFRFDVAHMVPVDFWNSVRDTLLKVKEVFLLAEADQPVLHEEAMNMSYDWRFHHIMNEVAQGKQTAVDMRNHFHYVDTAYPENSILMQFTSNHDENSWNGTVYERLGEGVKTFAALSFTVPGMPLIYNGQEACLDKRLEFFQRDPIQWRECELTDFYRELIDLKEENEELWCGDAGGNMEFISTAHEENVLAFIREKGENRLIALYNFSDENISLTLPENLPDEEFMNYFSKENHRDLSGKELNLNAWDYLIFVDRE
ncbi:MAG: alpha-amylase family glycosyl hydrolase [Bacteroidota bacterium]